MEKSNKISIRQLLIIYLIIAASPAIRVLPKHVIGYAKQAAWVTTFISVIPFIILLFVLNTLIKKTKKNSLDGIIEELLGKKISKLVFLIYFFLLLIVLSQYIRFFADRYASTISIFTPIKFFSAAILIAAYIITRKEIKYLARFLEVFIVPFYIFLAAIFFIAIPNMNIKNFLPITIYDTTSILKGLIPSLGVSSYVTIVFFLGDKVSNIGEFKKSFKGIALTTMIAAIAIIVVCLGTFGPDLASKFNQPFFMYIKSIKLLDIIERNESLLIATWIVTDLAMISFLIIVLKKLLVKIFNLNGEKELITPIILFAYISSNFIATNIFELVNFADMFVPIINISLAYIFPIIILIVGKIRKKV